MDSHSAVLALAALGQATRLKVFRLLLSNEPHGLAASDIAAHVGSPRNTMSGHLQVLAKAGLVKSRRDGRQIVYRANSMKLEKLILLLAQAQTSAVLSDTAS